MIDSDYYVDNTDEVFAAATIGSVGQGFRTLLKHFIASFFVFILSVTLLIFVYYSVSYATFDQEKAALDYFKTTQTSTVRVTYVYRGGNTADDTRFKYCVGNHEFFRFYSITRFPYTAQSGIWDYSTLSEDYNYRIIFDTVVKPNDINLDNMGYSMLCGRMPENSSEVAITKYLYDLYAVYGFNDHNQKISINTPEDVIGKTAFDRTIVGIVDTKMTVEILDINKLSSHKKSEYFAKLEGVTCGVHNGIFVTDASYMDAKLAGWEVLLNHDETDMIFYDMYKEYHTENGSYWAENKDSYIWWYISVDEVMIVCAPIMLGAFVLAIIFSLILLAGSFRDKKDLMAKMRKKEYEPSDYMELFIPELMILLISIVLCSVVLGLVGVAHLDKYEFFERAVFEEHFALAFGADLAIMCLMTVAAFFGIRNKIKKQLKKPINDSNRDFKPLIQDMVENRIEDKIIDRYR